MHHIRAHMHPQMGRASPRMLWSTVESTTICFATTYHSKMTIESEPESIIKFRSWFSSNGGKIHPDVTFKQGSFLFNLQNYMVQLTDFAHWYSPFWIFSLRFFRRSLWYANSIMPLLASDHPRCIKSCVIYAPQVTSRVGRLDRTATHLFIYRSSLDFRRGWFDIKVAIKFIPDTKHSVLSRSTQHASSKPSTLSRNPPISWQVDDSVAF